MNDQRKAGPDTPVTFTRGSLDRLYRQYNRKYFIHPDPLEFVYLYREAEDREVVGFVASALAYGRVAQILKSVRVVLDLLGPAPATRIRRVRPETLAREFSGFKHRFTTGADLCLLLENVKRALNRHGSLEACFLSKFDPASPTVLQALTGFAEELAGCGCGTTGMLLPAPERGSACKRLNLFLRWMVRSDEVDPGVWKGVPASKLIVPLDTHMHRISKQMGLTRRTQADMRTALEITDRFRSIAPGDPVRYDFALTRLGIRQTLDTALDL
ncbi:MAG: TIGR02757 family protein [Syntrophobacteraceae bacterium]